MSTSATQQVGYFLLKILNCQPFQFCYSFQFDSEILGLEKSMHCSCELSVDKEHF